MSENDLNLYCSVNECGHMPVPLKYPLDKFTVIRIFQFVKLFNKSLNITKRGAALNKDKKLNM